MTDVTQPRVLRARVPGNMGNRYPIQILTPEDVRALVIQCSEAKTYGVRYRVLIILLYRIGLRISKALAIRAKDVNLDRSPIATDDGGGSRWRLFSANSVVSHW